MIRQIETMWEDHLFKLKSKLQAESYPSVISLFVLNKANSVPTWHYVIGSNPLVLVFSSLSRNSDDLRRCAEVQLEKLVSVIVQRRPAAHVPSTASVVETRHVRSTVFVNLRRSCYQVVSQAAILKSHWLVTSAAYKYRNIGWIMTRI